MRKIEKLVDYDLNDDDLKTFHTAGWDLVEVKQVRDKAKRFTFVREKLNNS